MVKEGRWDGSFDVASFEVFHNTSSPWVLLLFLEHQKSGWSIGGKVGHLEIDSSRQCICYRVLLSRDMLNVKVKLLKLFYPVCLMSTQVRLSQEMLDSGM